MPVLANKRHERFAQELAKGETACAAYVTAGYAYSDANPIRLKNDPLVAARVVELLAGAAEKAEITIADIVSQLDEDRTFARGLNQPAPAITATMGKAKVLGFLSEKVEHTGKDGGPIEFDDMSSEDAVKRMLFIIAQARRDRAETIN